MREKSAVALAAGLCVILRTAVAVSVGAKPLLSRASLKRVEHVAEVPVELTQGTMTLARAFIFACGMTPLPWRFWLRAWLVVTSMRLFTAAKALARPCWHGY